MPLLEAATEGARLRFRPGDDDSFAFILGLLPLVIAEGPSQLARRMSARRYSAACSGVVRRHLRDPGALRLLPGNA